MTYDITPPINELLSVWPGDTPPTREILCSMNEGDNLTLSTLHATVHLGAHVDAPSHYGTDAPPIDQRSLDYYVGQCQVLRVDVPRGTRVTPDMIGTAIDSPRVLLATGTFPDPTSFNQDFAALSPELVEALDDPKKFAAAHVLLTSIRNSDFPIVQSIFVSDATIAFYNHMRIDFRPQIDFHREQRAELKRFWK